MDAFVRKPQAVIVDLDGTLANLNGRLPYGDAQADCINDLLHEEVATKVSDHYFEGLTIILVSGRFERYTDQTKDWLDRHNIPYEALYLRKDDDMRPDEVIKSEIYTEHIEPFYSVVVAYDDRPKILRAWASFGIPTVDCGFGIEF